MDIEKVRLANEKETYLSTLYGKALDARAEDSILGDTFADDVVRHIDFDFEKLKLPKGGEITLPMRAKQLDGWTREFLAAHPTSTVLNLGCGLDSRVFRIAPPAPVRWYDVDLPDVIELRRRLYPERHDCKMIASSVTDPPWLDAIPADRPVIVVAEGLVQYLNPEEAVAFFNRITEKFPSGQIIFDAYSRCMTGFINIVVRLTTWRSEPTAAGAKVFLPWGIDDPQELVAQIFRLKLVSVVPFLSIPELVERLSVSRVQRISARMMGRWAWYQNAIRHLRYEF